MSDFHHKKFQINANPLFNTFSQGRLIRKSYIIDNTKHIVILIALLASKSAPNIFQNSQDTLLFDTQPANRFNVLKGEKMIKIDIYFPFYFYGKKIYE